MKHFAAKWKASVARAQQGLAVLIVVQMSLAAPVAAFAGDDHHHRHHESKTLTPIKHVIVIIGENRTFDHVYATYKPRHHQDISNLLFKGIVNEDGTPGWNYLRSAQYSAVDNDQYQLGPDNKAIYDPLPPPTTSYVSTTGSDTAPPPFATLPVATFAETDLSAAFNPFLISGASGLPQFVPDTRIADVNNLRPGPYQITRSLAYDSYTGDPVHRFYQMWQEYDCRPSNISKKNPTGCSHDLFPWVEVTIGTGSNGSPQPANFNNLSTGEGAMSMGFYNVRQGDAPYMKWLADHYNMSDNMHQAIMGGTGANHIMFGFADDIWYSDGKGNPTVPPTNQIENPNPQDGTNNWYDQDGYSGGTFSDCGDIAQPGVAPIVNYLQSLPRPIDANCEPGHYYILNNYNPGYKPDGSLQTATFTIPPSSVRHIGDALMEKNISFAYYGGHWDRAVAGQPNAYCGICNPFQYATDIMTDPALRAAHIKDTTQLHKDIASGNLPAVTIVKPDGLVDGHPASSKLDLFEGFTKKIVDEVQTNKELWKDTAIVVTFDEGGGYYDSGYTQPLDFFGDGTRIPLIVISPYSDSGKIVHTYYDHVSITKFIEKNWFLEPLTARSRDNYPNPKMSWKNPYVPVNSPAIGDLMDMFDFDHDHDSHR
jgi:phospholipase C